MTASLSECQCQGSSGRSPSHHGAGVLAQSARLRAARVRVSMVKTVTMAVKFNSVSLNPLAEQARPRVQLAAAADSSTVTDVKVTVQVTLTVNAAFQ